ncbi:MAG: glycosyltransferase family 25 protein [Paracoccaceae bacterium]
MWPSYVINLAANTVRMDSVAAVLGGQAIPFERLDAVNGRALSAAEVARVYDAQANRRRGRHALLPGEIGCYLSHIAAWRRIAEGQAAGGFIFEDDIAATEDLGAVLASLSQDGGSDWDMVKLFTLDPEPKIVRERMLGLGQRLVVPYKVPTCLMGYGLTRKAALQLVARALPFFRPVDEDQKFFWETGLRVALVLPAPVLLGDQQTVTGTIGNARREVPKAGMMHRLHGLRYQLGYRAALHWHRWRERSAR